MTTTAAAIPQPPTVDTSTGRRFRVLVTGSRTWNQPQPIATALADLATEHRGRLTVVHGACPRGADAIADAWCARLGIDTERHPALWTTGRGAGQTRNAAMVRAGADLCLAFIRNNSPGASHCADLAEQAGIRTIRHEHHDQQPQQTLRSDLQEALLRNALGYVERGWAVFPVRPGDKRPAFPDHDADHCTGRDPRCGREGHHVGWEPRATTDPDRIRRAWSRAPYNIGVACGPSGLVVIDLDKPKPGSATPQEWANQGVRDGADVFGLLCAAHTDDGAPNLYDTYTVTTGRGGTHLYYRHPDTGPHLRNTSGAKGNGLGWLIDTRAHGGYVLGTGSVVNGRPYTLTRDTDPAPLAGWLADLLTPAPLPPQEPVTVALGAGTSAAYLDKAIHAALAAITAAPDGTLNATLYGAANRLGQFIAGGALDAAQAETLLLQTAVRAGHPSAGARRTIRSGFRAGARRPHTLARVAA